MKPRAWVDGLASRRSRKLHVPEWLPVANLFVATSMSVEHAIERRGPRKPMGALNLAIVRSNRLLDGTLIGPLQKEPNHRIKDRAMGTGA